MVSVSNEDIGTRWLGARAPESRGFDASFLGAGTGSGEDALGRLVGDVDRFARECWGRKPLLRPRAERDDSQDERFNDLFSLADLDHVISAGWLRYPGFAFRRSEEGAPNARRFDSETCTTTRMVGPRLVDDAADPGRIWSTLNKGLTLQLYRLHEMWPPLGRFNQDLGLALSHRTEASVFITPASSQGLPTHHDPLDVFVLQFAGRKEWSIFEPEVMHPTTDRVYRDDPGSECLTVVLEPGDCLYVPRGFPHRATSLKELSGHVSIACNTATWVTVVEELFERMLEELRADETIREPLPIGFARDDASLDAGLSSRMTRIASALRAEHAAAAARRVMYGFWASQRPLLDGFGDQLARIGELDDDSIVRRRHGAVALVSVHDGRLHIVLGDRELLMPADLVDIVRWIVDQPEFRVGTIPNLEPASRRTLVTRLVLAGLLEQPPRP
jgi:cupin superfamily protein